MKTDLTLKSENTTMTLEELIKERRWRMWQIILSNYNISPAAKHKIKELYGF
jgi:hypothetical protein